MILQSTYIRTQLTVYSQPDTGQSNAPLHVHQFLSLGSCETFKSVWPPYEQNQKFKMGFNPIWSKVFESRVENLKSVCKRLEEYKVLCERSATWNRFGFKGFIYYSCYIYPSIFICFMDPESAQWFLRYSTLEIKYKKLGFNNMCACHVITTNRLEPN